MSLTFLQKYRYFREHDPFDRSGPTGLHWRGVERGAKPFFKRRQLDDFSGRRRTDRRPTSSGAAVRFSWHSLFSILAVSDVCHNRSRRHPPPPRASPAGGSRSASEHPAAVPAAAAAGCCGLMVANLLDHAEALTGARKWTPKRDGDADPSLSSVVLPHRRLARW